MPNAAGKKNLNKKPSQGPLVASNPVLYQKEGARLPCVDFKNRSSGRGNEDQG